MKQHLTCLKSLLLVGALTSLCHAGQVQVALFDVDATPPLGAPMAYDPVKRVDELTLRCRGIILLGAGEPIVLCAVDWIGIGNEGNLAFRRALADAAGTNTARVAVHTLHQHDAPGCDFTAEKIVEEFEFKGYTRYTGDFHREVIQRAAEAVRAGLANARPVTHYGYTTAVVKEVASNRRVEVLEGGRIGRMRGSSSKVAELRALEEGLIDPEVSVLALWSGDTPVVVLSAYACHPQSYYRLGIPSPDFPGIARFMRGQDVNSALHLHFNGAGGNVAAGKYNDGSQPNRIVLATRLAEGMREAYEKVEKKPLESADIGWAIQPVHLPPAPHLDEEELTNKIREEAGATGSIPQIDRLAWLHRLKTGVPIDVGCLQMGDTRMLLLPGELFVEYQLAAKALRPDLRVFMAAYGDYGPGYIGTAAAYPLGGYEIGASKVAPEVEEVLMGAIRKLLDVK
jgi:hypothetical protein